MRRMTSWFVRDPVAANLLMILILVGSVFGSLKIGKEFFPNIPADYINITKSYPGAGPAEVEEQIIIPIEEAIYNLEGVAEIDSVSLSKDSCSILYPTSLPYVMLTMFGTFCIM